MPAPPSTPFDTSIVAALRRALPGLCAIYRYGSTGTEFERADSDIDLAVLAYPSLASDRLFDLSTELDLLCGHDIDLQDMASLPVTLRVQIVAHGVRLFAADHGAAEEYDSRVFSDYARLNEERGAILDDLRQAVSAHG